MLWSLCLRRVERAGVHGERILGAIGEWGSSRVWHFLLALGLRWSLKMFSDSALWLIYANTLSILRFLFFGDSGFKEPSVSVIGLSSGLQAK